VTSPNLTNLTPDTLPQGFLSPNDFHEGQNRCLTSKKRITAEVAGQGGGKTSAWYMRLYAMMRAFQGESHFVGFPTYMLLDRVDLHGEEFTRFHVEFKCVYSHLVISLT